MYPPMVYQQGAQPPIPAMGVLLWLATRQEHARIMVPGLVVSLYVKVLVSTSRSETGLVNNIRT